MTSVISIMVRHFESKNSCLVEKNVPKGFILPSGWQDGADSLGIETTSCLWWQLWRLQRKTKYDLYRKSVATVPTFCYVIRTTCFVYITKQPSLANTILPNILSLCEAKLSMYCTITT